MKTAVIDTGGGMRGAYSAGVIDRMILDGVHFDMAIGVSAGSGNLASFAAGQLGRNKSFYLEYPRRKEYMSLSNFFRKHSFFDMDYIYGTLTEEGGENALDLQSLLDSKTDLYVIATNCLTGKPSCFPIRRSKPDDYSIFKCSSSIPVVCRPARTAGLPFCDGTVSNPLPIDTALKLGAEKIVVIMARQPEPLKTSRHLNLMAAAAACTSWNAKYPNVVKALKERPFVYNASLEKARKLEEEGKLLFVSPQDGFKAGALTRNPDLLRPLYEAGLEDGKAIRDFLEKTDR